MAPASSGSSSAVAEAPSAEEDPLSLVNEFLNASTGKQEKPGGPPSCAVPYSIRFLVATVPDPLDSHLAQNFDRAVDAIQHGVQDSGYVLDRLYLPWKKDAETRWNLAVNPRGSPDGWLTLSPKAGSDLHRRTPGVLLFRGGMDRASELLVVFLVGEIPTSGIQREAFTRSLEAIGRCRTALPCTPTCESGKIRVLAPYFSGSAESLRNSLLARSRDDKGIEILSGSATVDRNRELLGPGRFQATVIPDQAMTEEFFGFLKKALDIEPRDVAFFVEGSTSYGSAAEQRFGSKPAESESVRFVIQFPLHVSQLRGAYEKDEALKGGSVLNRGPRHTLELPLETSERDPRDILPPQDPKMTSNVAELSLAAGIETIRRAHVRLVGIIATDPRDVLFLGRKIREAGANVTLFTFGADILFAHPDYQRFLRGMLIATPYPLFPQNQRWTGAGRRRIVFSGSTEEGIYNAAVLLLADPARAGPPARPMEYSAPDGSNNIRPPVWVTAVGRGGFWPVAFFPGYNDRGYVRRSPAPPLDMPKRRYWPEGALLSFLIVDFFFACLVFFYFQERIWRRFRRYSRAEELFSIWSQPVSRGTNRVYVAALFAMAFVVQATLLTWFSRARKFFGEGPPIGLGLAAALFICLAAVVVREVVRFGQDVEEDPPPPHAQWVRWLRFSAPLSLIAFVGWPLVVYLWQIMEMEKGKARAFSARALDLTSTLSPLVPFLLTMFVFVLWTICNLQRAFLLEVQGIPQVRAEDDGRRAARLRVRPKPYLRLRSLRGLERLQSDVLDCLGNPCTRIAMLLVPLLTLVPFYKTILHDYTTIDGQEWSRLLRWLFVCCHVVVVYSFAVFVLVWARLRRFLQRLAPHPVVDAFRRLPESCAATPWKLWKTVPNLTTLAASVAQLRTVVNLGDDHLKADYPDLMTHADRAEELLRQIFTKDPKSVARSLKTQLDLRKTLVEAKGTLLTRLEGIWAQWPERSDRELPRLGAEERTLGIPEWKRREVPAGLALWARAAEEFIALRMSAFIRGIFQHMKNLLGFVFLGFLLVVVAISSYPFEPKHSVMTIVWVVILPSIVLIAWIFISMERDPVLSYIGKTEPGKVHLSLDLLSSVGIYIVIPLLTLVATQFPGVGDVIFSIFNPAMRSLSH